MFTVAKPYSVPLVAPKNRPVGKVPLISHDVISPGPVSVGTSGKSLLPTPRTKVRLLGLYWMSSGTWSTISRVRLNVVLPPVLLAYTVKFVAGSSWVGMPQSVPLLLPRKSPDGKDGWMSQVRISPGPVSVGVNGKSGLAVLLVRLSSVTSNESVGSWSMTLSVMVAIDEPPLLLAQTV